MIILIFSFISLILTTQLKKYTLSGTVTGTSGVTVFLTGDANDSLTVDDGGNYSFTVACSGSYTVTPVMDCYEFTPAVQQFNVIKGNAVQDFSAALITFVLTGTITGSDYVTVTLGGDADEIQIVYDGGMYSFTVICGSNYSIIPSKPGHKFTPDYIAYNNVKSDKNRNITVKSTQLPDGLVLALIPGGSFQMGSNDGLEDEKPVHTVTLDSYDMSGNVWEWCHDWYGPYEEGSADNPTGPFTGTVRVKRGGGWISDPELNRTAQRSSYNDTYTGPHVGFRIVR